MDIIFTSGSTSIGASAGVGTDSRHGGMKGGGGWGPLPFS